MGRNKVCDIDLSTQWTRAWRLSFGNYSVVGEHMLAQLGRIIKAQTAHCAPMSLLDVRLSVAAQLWRVLKELSAHSTHMVIITHFLHRLYLQVAPTTNINVLDLDEKSLRNIKNVFLCMFPNNELEGWQPNLLTITNNQDPPRNLCIYQQDKLIITKH